MKEISLAQLATDLGGDLEGDPEVIVTGVAPLSKAGPGEVSFLANPKYTPSLGTTSAGGVIVSREVRAPGLNLIRVEDPYLGFAMAMELFHGQPYVGTGVSEHACVHPEALVGDDPSIHPFVVVSRAARVGCRVTLMPGAYVGPGVTIGDDTTIHPNVVLEKNVHVGRNVIIHAGTVVGSDGFGFARKDGGSKKIIHAGTVRIEDDVEIGAGCTIDRAVMGETVIGKGSKLDNLIQIAHNVRIGPDCIIVAQVGIAGSTELEGNVTIAGQSGVAGHLKIGSGAVLMARSTVFKDVPPGAWLAGTPAIDADDWKRSSSIFKRLDDFRRRLVRLEKELSAMTGRKPEEGSD